MRLELIEYNSQAYQEMLDLRNRVLREPLGLKMTKADIRNEARDYFVGFYTNEEELIGCCVLSPLNDVTVQLRQMVVDTSCQKMGVGNKLLAFAEELAQEKMFQYVFLHARKDARPFYEKNNYEVVGDEFIEVGIPHFNMLKQVAQSPL